MGIMGIIGVMGDMEQRHIIKKRYTQWHSKFSKLRNSPLSPLCLFSPSASKNCPAQPHSKFSKSEMGHMRLMRPMRLMENEKGSVEDGSKISKRGVGDLRSLGILGRKTGMENTPAQRHSKFSKLRNSPLSLSCLFSPSASKNTPAQPLSKISKLWELVKDSSVQRDSKMSKRVVSPTCPTCPTCLTYPTSLLSPTGQLQGAK